MQARKMAMECTLYCIVGTKMSLTKVEERATGACWFRHVSVSVQRYSVQYKGHNLVGVITVEGGVTRGMTVLVYWHYISAYIQELYMVTGVHPTGLTFDQGCRQVSTKRYIFWLKDAKETAEFGLSSVSNTAESGLALCCQWHFSNCALSMTPQIFQFVQLSCIMIQQCLWQYETANISVNSPPLAKHFQWCES